MLCEHKGGIKQALFGLVWWSKVDYEGVVLEAI